jgi:class 3 adenylate cyclase
MVGHEVRGVAVHAAARIMAEAGGDEVLVSKTVRLFATAGLAFEDRGVHALKGLDGEWRLSRFVPDWSG